jgi:hypothetical protein
MGRRNSTGRTYVPRSSPPGKKRRTRNQSRLACKGKVRYRDKQEADAAIKFIGKGDQRQKTPGRSYFCESCRGWHLSSAWSHDKAGIMKVDRFDKFKRID